MFESIPAAQADPILGLIDVFHADNRLNKINLVIGVYKDETGNTPIFKSVKKAESLLLENETSKNYLSIDGLSSFAKITQCLIFGKDSDILKSGRARSAQTPGGTGALRVAADFIANNTSVRRVWISKPSWPNHKNIFSAAGLQVCDYAYYNTITHSIDFQAMKVSLSKAKAGDVVVLHGCCHNPTGMDPTKEQWEELSDMSVYYGWLPLFDFAYQGFANGLEEDAKGLRIFCASHKELIVCSSFSKNFGLYNERVGACTLIAYDREIANCVLSQLKVVIRANYSNPPAHGAAIVTTILSNDVLRALWEKELNDIRHRIQRMRQLFVETLIHKGAKKDFSFIQKHNGMFSFIGLTQEQVLKIRHQSGVYLLNSGRINIAGMTSNNMVSLCEAIVSVL